jgi:hypothetical protein
MAEIGIAAAAEPEQGASVAQLATVFIIVIFSDVVYCMSIYTDGIAVTRTGST